MTSEFSQRWSADDSNTAGNFLFHEDASGRDVSITKLVYGADGADPTVVTSASGIPIASDDIATLASAVSGSEVQVDIVGALPAGDNNIGNVDVVTLPDVTNAGTFAVQESRAHTEDFDTGGGTDTTAAFGIAVPASGGAVVVPGDATSGLKVNLGADNDISLSVLPDTAAGDLASMAADLGTLAGGVSGSEFQVDVVTIPTTTVQGVDAEDAAVSGRPVLIGGRYDATDRTLDDGDVGAIALSHHGGVMAHLHSEISTGNSSTSTLGSGATFTGTAEDIADHAAVVVFIYSDVDSATDGVSFEWSTDGTNWDKAEVHTLTGGETLTHTFLPEARYFRIRYTNGGTGQSEFRLQSIMHGSSLGPKSERIDATVEDNDVATLVRSVLTAKRPGGTYANIEATAGGNLKVSVQEISDGLDVGAGNVGAETQRVTIATDDVNLAAINTNIATLAGAVSGSEMQVDVVAALPSGANTIGDVTISGDALTALQLIDDAVYTDGTGTPSKGLAVMGTDGTNPQIISTNTSGHVNIADGGNTITIDGSVTLSGDLPDTAAGDLASMASDLGTLAATVSGNEVQVDVVASLPTGSNTIGDVTISGSALTALQLLDDIVESDGSGSVASGAVVLGKDGTTPRAIAVNNSGEIQIDLVEAHTEDYDTGAGTDTTIAFGIAVPASGGAVVVPGDATAGLKVDLGADNDVTMSTLPDTASGDLAAINTNTTDLPNAIGTDGAAGPSKTVSIGGTDSFGTLREVRLNTSNHVLVNVAGSVLPSGAATASNQATIYTFLDTINDAVQVMDDWDETDRCAVNLIASQTGVTGGSGTVDAATQRVTVATDDVVSVDATGQGDVPVSLDGEEVTVNHATTGFGDGVKTVSTAGTDEALAGSTTAKWVTIQAQTDNTDYVAVGASGVDATEATGTGVLLAAGDVITLPCDNLADVYVDSLVSGEGVRYVYGT